MGGRRGVASPAMSWPPCRRYIRVGEVVALEQQRRRGEARNRIGHAVAVIQRGAMAAPSPEIAKRAVRDRCMGGREVDDRDVLPSENVQQIAMDAASGVAGGDDDRLQLG